MWVKKTHKNTDSSDFNFMIKNLNAGTLNGAQQLTHFPSPFILLFSYLKMSLFLLSRLSFPIVILSLSPYLLFF